MAKGDPISFRLSAEAIELLRWAEDTLGLKRSAAVELALRELRDRWAGTHTQEKKRKKSGAGA